MTQSNKRGFITFATAGPNTRTTQVFINFGDNAGLDRQGFAPFGQVVSGMDFVDALNAEYGEGAPRGNGPDQGRLQAEGNEYLAKEYSADGLRQEGHDREIVRAFACLPGGLIASHERRLRPVPDGTAA